MKLASNVYELRTNLDGTHSNQAILIDTSQLHAELPLNVVIYFTKKTSVKSLAFKTFVMMVHNL